MHSTATADDDVATAAAINLGLFSRKGEFGCWRGEERGGNMYVPPAGENHRLPLFPATHATETFKSFWRQKERCRPLREPKLDSRRGRQPYNLIPAIYSKRTLLARLCASLSPLLLLPCPSPMFVLQSLNHLTTSAAAGRVRECVSGSGRGREGALRLPTDRIQRTASSSRIECGVRPSRTPLCKLPANPWRLPARRGQTPSLPYPGGCGAV